MFSPRSQAVWFWSYHYCRRDAAGCLDGRISTSVNPQAVCTEVTRCKFFLFDPCLTFQGHLHPATEVGSD